jgi:hypothetical protein
MRLHRPALPRAIRSALVPFAIASLSPGIGDAQQPAQEQQPATLSGRVTNAQGDPLSSASVVIQQLNLAATTR